MPGPIRGVRFGFTPLFQFEEVLSSDPALAQPLEQVIPEGRRKAGPLDLRHQSANVMRASSSLRRLIRCA